MHICNFALRTLHYCWLIGQLVQKKWHPLEELQHYKVADLHFYGLCCQTPRQPFGWQGGHMDEAKLTLAAENYDHCSHFRSLLHLHLSAPSSPYFHHHHRLVFHAPSSSPLSPSPGADPVKGHGCTHVHPIIFAITSKLGGLSKS